MNRLTTSLIRHRLGRAVVGTAAALTVLPLAAAHAAPPAGQSVSAGSMYAVVDQIGARALWAQGITGTGVNVAVIDTGVLPVPALARRVTAMVDLSAEAAVPEARYLDSYGHGTHIAGIIAGHDPQADPALAAQHPEWFLGVAPDAGIVSVKVGDNTGAVDLSQVIAGVDWVVAHAADLNIRVLNLSYSSGSPLPAATDPLTHALERAWDAGIVVVVAAGNDGRRAHGLASPAIDPYVIAVAAVEVDSNSRFRVPTWASSGNGDRDPDLAAPGAHIESLRAPGSRVAIEHPEGYVSESLFRGSGSSQAAAVVSGSVALLLDARPTLTPDQVKALLVQRSQPTVPASSRFTGAGTIRIDAVAALDAPSIVQDWPRSDGSGSLEAARGGNHVLRDGAPFVGEVTVGDAVWTGTSWTGTSWTGTSWTGTSWTGTSWTGTSWTGTSWTGTSWTGTSWTGTSWTGTSWT